MSSSMFDRLCTAYWENTAPPKPPWDWLEESMRNQVRRGVAALLREMKQPSEKQLSQVEPALDRLYNGVKADPGYEAGGEAVWQAMIDAILAEAAEEVRGDDCEHEWISIKNERVLNGEMCLKCRTIRP